QKNPNTSMRCSSVSAINGELKNNAINIYNEAGKTTGTDENAYEVVVGADGVIKAVGGHNNTVPEGGYVISGKGDAKSYLIDYAKAGRSVLFDRVTKTVYINGEKIERNETASSAGSGLLKGVIIGALVLILISTGAYIIINKKNKKTKKESLDQ
ncbi:MAG TPA: hypothetical protein PK795_09530, partial [Bacillota bacterium]|nr:hypothetical protein [Bacillota bacterium]